MKRIRTLIAISLCFNMVFLCTCQSTDNIEISDDQIIQEEIAEDNIIEGTEEVIDISNGEKVIETSDELEEELSEETKLSQETDVEAIEENVEELPSVELVMVGDMLLHMAVEKSAIQEEGNYDFDAIFSETKDMIESADIALVNEEVILGGEDLGISGYPTFNAPFHVADDLVEAGFDVVCSANNHSMDKGKKGLLNCIAYWDENYPNIGVIGIHDTENEEIYITECEGIKIAILNYTYGTNGLPLPSDMPYAVDLLNEEKVVSDIAAAKEKADFVIVVPHWGTEYRLTPDSSQEKWTKIFVQNGVDLVIGTHPHVIEPIEYVYDEETGNEMLVYYSLGNYVNWTHSNGSTIGRRVVGGMAKVTLQKDEEGNVDISEYGVKALVTHLEYGQNGVVVYPLSDYSEELAMENKIKIQDSGFDLQYCIDLCDEVWGDLWE